MNESPCIEDVISLDPEIMHGTPVFRGSRVPIRALLDHIEAGEPLETFLEAFPTVSRELAVGFVELAGQTVIQAARARTA